MWFSVFALEKLALYGPDEVYTKQINGKITELLQILTKPLYETHFVLSVHS